MLQMPGDWDRDFFNNRKFINPVLAFMETTTI
jgi:hypothetical protein